MFKLEPECAFCGKPGTRQPQLRIWAQGQKKKHPPATASYGLLLCDDCKLDTELESKAMEAFRAIAKSLGKSPPGYYETVYVPLGAPEIYHGTSN